MRRLVLLASALVAALVTGGCSFTPPRDGAAAPPSEFTFVAPGGKTRLTYDPPETRGTVRGLAGEDLADASRRLALDDFAGRVVVLNIWGSWCGPCRDEVPDLQEVYRSTRDDGVTVLGVAVRDDRDAARDFLRSRDVEYPSILDPPARSLAALRGFPPNVVPSTLVLDRGHRVAAVFLGTVRISELLPVVERIAAEPAPVAAGGQR
ncbi:TlpA family protein disulfide reductase [Pseudonocardia dioxanivorans]|uniref:TlpA family protein disulfide reductase n=1 Tax=Pseudonocardia dioxanivorans TaxID=240495 RepID=UPI001404F055|nr:TlpA disulfide reductase family protein [Pseudonocardia dioxanivorans]